MPVAVSVIVPVFNAEEYLDKCINSIFAQTLTDIEIILVDDGSKDRSGNICDCYASKDYRIKVIHQDNFGAATARNTGMLYASGEYLGFVDSDDWIEPCMYSVMYNSAKQNDADIVWCNVLKNECEKQRKYIPSKVYEKEDIEKVIYPLLIADTNEKMGRNVLRGSACLRIFRKELVDRCGIRFHEDLIYNEDQLFCIQCTLAASRYIYLGNDYLYHNRFVPDSITKRYISGLWKKQRRIYSYLFKIDLNSDYCFTDQVYKKMFDVAVYCIENACRNADKKAISKEIKAICSDDLVRKALKKTDRRKMKKINKAYYIGITFKNTFILKRLFDWRYHR